MACKGKNVLEYAYCMHNDDKNIGLEKVEIVRMNSIYNSEIIKIEEEGRGENMYNEYNTFT